MLDLAVKLDSTAEYVCKQNWGDIDFPPPFGRDALPEVRVYLCEYVVCVCVCVTYGPLICDHLGKEEGGLLSFCNHIPTL